MSGFECDGCACKCVTPSCDKGKARKLDYEVAHDYQDYIVDSYETIEGHVVAVNVGGMRFVKEDK